MKKKYTIETARPAPVLEYAEVVTFTAGVRVDGDRLVTTETVNVSKSFLRKVSVLKTVSSENPNAKVTYIEASLITNPRQFQKCISRLNRSKVKIKGGIGTNSVEIKLKSKRHLNINYKLRIYAIGAWTSAEIEEEKKIKISSQIKTADITVQNLEECQALEVHEPEVEYQFVEDKFEDCKSLKSEGSEDGAAMLKDNKEENQSLNCKERTVEFTLEKNNGTYRSFKFDETLEFGELQSIKEKDEASILELPTILKEKCEPPISKETSLTTFGIVETKRENKIKVHEKNDDSSSDHSHPQCEVIAEIRKQPVYRVEQNITLENNVARSSTTKTDNNDSCSNENIQSNQTNDNKQTVVEILQLSESIYSKGT